MLKRSISLLLCAVLTLSLCVFALPETALAGTPAEPEVVYLGGIPVTEGYWTYDDDAHTLTTATSDDYNVRYQSAVGTATSILTLNGVTVEKNYYTVGRSLYAALYAAVPLTIELNNTNRLAGPDGAGSIAGIFIGNACSLTISGAGILEANGGNIASVVGNSYGIHAGRDVNISGGTVIATGGSQDPSYGCSYGIFASIGDVHISGGTVEAKGNTMALNKYPDITDNALIPHVIKASQYFNGEPIWEYDYGRVTQTKYFKAVFPPVSIAGLPMTASATESSYFNINNTLPYDPTVYTAKPEVWDFKLELVEGKYKLTTTAYNQVILTNVGGIKSNVDLILCLGGNSDYWIDITASNEPAMLVNGNLSITAADPDTGLHLTATNSIEGALNVTGNLTLECAKLDTTATANAVGSDPVSALVVGGDLTVNARGTISARAEDPQSLKSNRGAKVNGNVVMNGGQMNCKAYGGIGLEAGRNIMFNSGDITLSGIEKALSKPPILDASFSHIWAFSNNEEQLPGYSPQTYNTTQPYSYSDNHKYLRIVPTPSASISPVEVSGTVNTAITATTTTITLENQSFSEILPNTDVSSWFTNIPSGLTATINSAVAEGAKTATVTFSGTPTETRTVAMTVAIPKEELDIQVDLTATNASAKWNIAPAPTVTSVAVNPASVSITKGGTKTFAATVTGTNSPAQTVTWSVSGGVSGTTIDEKGVLTVAANETAATLTVKATSTVNTSKFGTATVTVTTPAPNPEPSDSDGGSSDYTPASVTVYNDPVQPKATVWLSGSGLTAGDQLITKQNPQGAAFTVMRTVAGKNEVVATYDISLQSGKKSTGSAMSLTFDLGTTRAGQEFTLVHQKADGTLEYFYAVADSTGRLVFNGINSLSPFMLVKGRLAQTAYTSLTDMPKTGDNAQPALVTSIVLLMAAASLAGVALRKRRD